MANLANKHFLVVDDHASMRRIIRNFLENEGITRVSEAANGVEALHVLESKPADIIISDLHMPKMNGLDLLQIIRNTEKIRNIPFIMVTVEAIQKTMLKAITMKVDSYIVKPFEGDQLIDEIHRVVDEKAAAGLIPD